MSKGPLRNDAWSRMGAGWGIASTLLAGILVCGGIGYLIDLLIGVGRVFFAVGMVAGAIVGVYVVYVQYGRSDSDGRA
jgi:ATP synthase protein I